MNCDNVELDVSTATIVGSCTIANNDAVTSCQEWGWAGWTGDYATDALAEACENGGNQWSDEPCDISNAVSGCRTVSLPIPSKSGCYSQVVTAWYAASTAPKKCPSGFEKVDP